MRKATNSSIFIAGHKGMLGSAIYNKLKSLGYKRIITKTKKELDLTVQRDVQKFFSKNKIEYVFLCAGKVGGIHANNTYPAEFIKDNLLIQTNLIDAAFRSKSKRLLFLGSSCIYPKYSKQPIKENNWFEGNLENSNRAMATAKIAGIEMCWSYNRQYNKKNSTKYYAVMPTNLYGPNDHYGILDSHVLPALLRKFHIAKIRKSPQVTVWGTGNVFREFLFSKDAADACIHLMFLSESKLTDFIKERDKQKLPPIINIGTEKDITIRELAYKIKRLTKYEGKIIFDKNKLDGTPKKLLDCSTSKKLGWSSKTSLDDGLDQTYLDFKQKINKYII